MKFNLLLIIALLTVNGAYAADGDTKQRLSDSERARARYRTSLRLGKDRDERVAECCWRPHSPHPKYLTYISPLEVAAKDNNTPAVETMLATPGIKDQYNLSNALKAALDNHNDTIARLLLSHGAAIEFRHSRGWEEDLDRLQELLDDPTKEPILNSQQFPHIVDHWLSDVTGHLGTPYHIERDLDKPLRLIKQLLERKADANVPLKNHDHDQEKRPSASCLEILTMNALHRSQFHQRIVDALQHLYRRGAVGSRELVSRIPFRNFNKEQRLELRALHLAHLKDNPERDAVAEFVGKDPAKIVYQYMYTPGNDVLFELYGKDLPSEKIQERVLSAVGEGLGSSKNEEGKTDLMYAAEKGDVDIAQFFIARGTKVADQDSSGTTALMYAARAGNADVATLLCTACKTEAERKSMINAVTIKGPDITPRARSGRRFISSALSAQVRQQTIRYRRNHQENGKEEQVVYSVPFNQTALIMAVFPTDSTFIPSANVVRLLLQHGADATIKDAAGKTALDYVRENTAKPGYAEIAEMLSKHAHG